MTPVGGFVFQWVLFVCLMRETVPVQYVSNVEQCSSTWGHW